MSASTKKDFEEEIATRQAVKIEQGSTKNSAGLLISIMFVSLYQEAA